MALYIFDASALVKYYIREPGSTWVRQIIDAPGSHFVFISEVSLTECAAAFAALHRTGRISRRAQEGAFRLLMSHIASGVLETIPMLSADYHAAARLTQKHPLKAYDAIQLAVALRHSRALSAGELASVFVSGDDALLAAAQTDGLTTDNPFDHVQPEDTARTGP